MLKLIANPYVICDEDLMNKYLVEYFARMHY